MVWGGSTMQSVYNGATSAFSNVASTAAGVVGEAAKWGTYIGTGTLYDPWKRTAAESVAPTDAKKTKALTTTTDANKSRVKTARTGAETAARQPRYRGDEKRPPTAGFSDTDLREEVATVKVRQNSALRISCTCPSQGESGDTKDSDECFDGHSGKPGADTAEEVLAVDTQAGEVAATRGYLSYLAAPFTTVARCVAWPFKTTYKAATAVARTGQGVASTVLGGASNGLSYFVPETVKNGFRSWLPTYGGEVVNRTLVDGTTVNPAETVKTDQTVPRTRRYMSGTENDRRRECRTRGSRSSSPDATDKGTVPETERKETSPAPRATSSAHDVGTVSLQNSPSLLTEEAEGDLFRRRVADSPRSTLVAARA